METSRQPSSFWSRLLVLPAIVGLVAASVIVGYAGDDLLTNSGKNRVSRLTPAAAQTGASADADSSQADDPLGNYETALGLVKNNFYGAPVDPKKSRQLTYEAIRGMLDSLRDQFTSFLDPDEWMQMQATTKGDFEGIGALLQQDGTEVKVVEPIETSPAEKAGIKPDDVITRVDGKSVIGKDINDVVRLIKGKRGTTVKVGIVRGKTPLEFTLQRALVEPPIVKHWMEDNDKKIGHIVLKEFNEKSMEQLELAYNDLQKQGMRALVFDLRYNPGGLLTVAIDVASFFIPADENKDLNNAVVWVKEGSGKEQSLNLKGQDNPHAQIPMVVLTNGMSASASEIVSGSIKDYGVATLMGERTFGKGLVQTLFPLADGSALRLTTAKYYTPKHTDINRKHDEDGDAIPGSGGILPDIEVKQSEKWKPEAFADKVNDTQLQRALDFLRARLDGQTLAQATEHVRQLH